MAVKLIVCDIDGTLVTDKTKTIPPENKTALLAAQDQGILVTIASGRVPSGLAEFAQELEITKNCKYVIGGNGGAVMNLQTGEYVYDEMVSYEDTLWAMAIVKEMGNDFYLAPLDEKMAYVSSERVIAEDIFLFRHTKNIPVILDWNAIPQMRKVVISCSDQAGQQWLRRKVAKNHNLRVEVTGYGYIEIMPKNVNKWNGILKLIVALKTNEGIKINKDEIMCFGDQMNDYEMIKNAKYGIALANATSELKAVAKDVTKKDNNHAGVADYLYDHLLTRKEG
ncbi:Cof-type HAD-IIB family hydrolase [Spiroplasma eriocheiris]|uniref:Cof-like hydrolase n=1 Tax=Spiroplasma eriocheiris TaxID=315358 RepID=A0A0H3XK57_9MOLU|nr:Cof-type HAD-IIB family hydrolase [Spiroplasma eriocheiris]AHF57261.1 putative HAD superfamily hydrolase [Spiroplasma eriocheiris CCTCC M 207170]AKM53724.1 Cof-like hydrolase [Spiroplasma eriocheiris]